jgi:drug/metabolite transporter (DMT)-like permease
VSFGLLVLFLTSAIGGFNPVVIKIGATEIPPLTLVAIRFFLAAIIFLPFCYKRVLHLSRRDIFKLTVLSGLFTLNVALFSTAIQYTTVIMSQIISMVSPIFVGVFAIFLVKEHIKKEQITGVGIALIGVIFLLIQSFQSQSGNTFGSPFGNMLVFFSMILWCLYLTLSRRVIRRYSPITVSFFTVAVSGVSLLCIAVPIELFFRPLTLSNISLTGIGSVVYLVFIATLFFFPLMQYGIKHTSAFTASLTSYISPIFGGIAAVVVFHEQITHTFLIGSIFILVGVFYSTGISQLKKYIPAVLEYVHG